MKRLLTITMIIILIYGSFFITVPILYPLAYKEIVLENSLKYDLDPKLVFAVIKTESNFDTNAVSNKGAKGLMQVSETTGRWGSEDLKIDNYNDELLYDPGINISIGTWYLNLLLNQYKELDTALAAYNAGSGNVSSWLSDPNYSEDGVKLYRIPFPETREYVNKVKDNINIYSRFYRDSVYYKGESLFEELIFKIRIWLMDIRNNR